MIIMKLMIMITVIIIFIMTIMLLLLMMEIMILMFMNKWKVSNPNGVSRLYIIVEIYTILVGKPQITLGCLLYTSQT